MTSPKLTILNHEGDQAVLPLSLSALKLLASCVEIGFEGADDAPVEDLEQVGQVLHYLKLMTED